MKKIFTVILTLILSGCNSYEPEKKTGSNSSTNYNHIKYPLPTAADSLLTLLKTVPDDTNKVNILNSLGQKFRNSNPDTSIKLSNQALSLAEKINASPNSILKMAGKKGIANSLRNLAVYTQIKSDFPKALEYYLKALKIDEELNNKKGIATCLGNIGNVYLYLGDFREALNYYFKALKKREELGAKNLIASCLGNIGSVYYQQKNKTKALYYFLKSLKMDEELGDKNGMGINLDRIGIVYNDQGDYRKAHEYYSKALMIVKELGDKVGTAIQLGNIGTLYADQKKYEEAEKYLSDALKLDKEIGDLNTERQFEELITDLYEKTNRFHLALEHYKNAMLLKDTLFSKDKNKEITKKEMNYEFAKKEAEEKAEQEKKDAITQADVRKQKIILQFVIGSLFLVCGFAGFIFWSLRVTRKQKEIIEIKSAETEQQKRIIEGKNKDILDSIYYASRIQRSLLPSEKYIHRHLKRLGNI